MHAYTQYYFGFGFVRFQNYCFFEINQNMYSNETNKVNGNNEQLRR